MVCCADKQNKKLRTMDWFCSQSGIYDDIEFFLPFNRIREKESTFASLFH